MLKSWNIIYDLVLPEIFKSRKNNKPSGNLCHSPTHTYIWYKHLCKNTILLLNNDFWACLNSVYGRDCQDLLNPQVLIFSDRKLVTVKLCPHLFLTTVNCYVPVPGWKESALFFLCFTKCGYSQGLTQTLFLLLKQYPYR